MKTNRFISFEGVDGAGKSTHMQLVADWLRQQGQEVVCTREPGGTALGDAIRERVLSPDMDELTAEAELLLFFAARAEHIARVINPAIGRRAWVLCDRYLDSSFAYQGAGRGLRSALVIQLAQWLPNFPIPRLTLLLDIPLETIDRRVAGAAPDRMDSASSDFHTKVIAAFRARAEAEPERICRIDADRPVALVQQAIRSRVALLIP